MIEALVIVGAFIVGFIVGIIATIFSAILGLTYSEWRDEDEKTTVRFWD